MFRRGGEVNGKGGVVDDPGPILHKPSLANGKVLETRKGNTCHFQKAGGSCGM
jgi:hypothetical protein